MDTEHTCKSPKKEGRINSTLLSQKKGSLKKRCGLIVITLIMTSTNLTVLGLREQSFFGLEPEFHTYSEVVSELFQTESDHSTIASVFLLGKSYQNRDILGIKISDNVSTDESEPEAFICAMHHAREAATVEVAMYIINYLTDHYGRPGYEQVTYLVDNREIYIIPIVNVDGKIFDDSSRYYGFGQYWRKNRQTCSGGTGIDLNRNYSYHWAERDASSCCADPSIFRGYEPFDAPETAAIRDFVAAHPDIAVFLDYHSYAGLVLWPWGYTETPISNLEDRQVHEIIGREYAALTDYIPMQVSDLYCCSGISIDWSYGITQDRDVPIFSWTIELWGESYPPATGFYPDPSDIPFLCESNCEAALYVIECADNPYKVLKQWKMSNVSEDEPVDDRGNPWYEAGFDDSQWKSIYLPGRLEPESRKFFRHHFTVYHETQQVLLDSKNCESITIYVNGQIIQQGKDPPPQEDLKLKNQSPVDITAYVHHGENVIAVQVATTSEFDMSVTQRTDMYDHKEWKVFPGSERTNPGKGWYTSEYDDSAWDTITLPDELPRTGGGYYRRTFTVPDYTRVFIDFSDGESMTLYVNEQIVEQWELSKNQPPIDITAYVHCGENVIAVHTSGEQPFDFTLIRPKILPDLRLTDQDIYFSAPCPAPQDEITIYATVHNGAAIAVPSASVRFYSGNPGRRLLIDELSVEVPPASSTVIEIQWVYPGGEHDIYVVIDESNDIPEPEREHNNNGHRSLPAPNYFTWPMFRHDVHHTGTSPLKGTIDNPAEKWRFFTNGPVRSSPAVADINNDGDIEIVFGSDDHTLYAVTCEGSVLWSYQTADCIRSSPAIADLNSDGDTEIVFGSDDGNVYVLQGKDGSVVWKYFVNEKIRSCPLIYDLDNNGKMEIIFGSHNFVIYALRDDGTLLWTFSTGDKIDSSPAIATVEGDCMVVVGSGDGKLHFVDAESGRKKWDMSACGTLESSPAIADIDRDGDMEVVIGSSGNSIYAEGSRFFWNTVVEGSVRSSPAIADINGDGTTEVIVGSDGGAVYALNSNNGLLLWSYHTGGSIFSSPAVADIDGDGRCNVIAGSGDTCCYALTGDGRLLWKFPTGGGIESSPAIADIDRDGYAEIVVGSNDGYVYVLDSEGVSSWIGLLIGILGVFLLLLFLLEKRKLHKSTVLQPKPYQAK